MVESVALANFAYLLCLNETNKSGLTDTKVNLFRVFSQNLEAQYLLVKQALEF